MIGWIFNLYRFYQLKRQKLQWAYEEYLVSSLKKEKGGFFSGYGIKGVQQLERGIVAGELMNKRFVLNCNISDEIEGRMLITQIWDKALIEMILTLLERREGVILDIGANVGAVTIPLSALLPQREFFCFEPHPVIIKRLESNIRMNCMSNISIVQKAASDVNGEIAFYAQDNSDNMGLSSMVETAVTVSNKKMVVESITLNEFVKNNNLNKVALIKIDVQGAEINVLRGMTEVLKTARPVVVFEQEDYLHQAQSKEIRSEINTLLKGNRYKMYNASSLLLSKYGYANEIDLNHPFDGNIVAIPD